MFHTPKRVSTSLEDGKPLNDLIRQAYGRLEGIDRSKWTLGFSGGIAADSFGAKRPRGPGRRSLTSSRSTRSLPLPPACHVHVTLFACREWALGQSRRLAEQPNCRSFFSAA